MKRETKSKICFLKKKSDEEIDKNIDCVDEIDARWKEKELFLIGLNFLRNNEEWIDFRVLFGCFSLSGHWHGTQTSAINQTLARVNAALERLLQGLHERSLLHCVNVLVVSDHGMEDMTCDKATFLQPIFGNSSSAANKLLKEDYRFHSVICIALNFVAEKNTNHSIIHIRNAKRNVKSQCQK